MHIKKEYYSVTQDDTELKQKPLEPRDEISAFFVSDKDQNSSISNVSTNNQGVTQFDLSSSASKELPFDFLYHIIDSFTQPFYVIDADDYSIKLANGAVGIKQIDEYCKCHSIIYNSDTPCWEKGQKCPLTEVKRKKESVVIEHVHFDKNGELRNIEVHADPVFDSTGKITHIIMHAFDITEQKCVESQLATESRRARLYLDLLAHDVANELQVVQGSAELTKELLPPDVDLDMIPVFVNQILESVNRCMILISKARATENLAIAPLVERSINRALMDCIETIGEDFDHCVVEFEGEDTDAMIMADKYLEDLFLNLLSNAIKHNTSTPKYVWIRVTPSGEGYEISIADNGPGIDDVMKELMLDPRHRIGGLGIHFSLQIIEKYGGKISVNNRISDNPGEGVEFLIWLPKFQRSTIQ